MYPIRFVDAPPLGAGKFINGLFSPLCCVLLALFVSPLLPAEDVRRVPMDMTLIIDGSAALGAGREEAVSWLCDHVVDELLRDGDRLTIWIAAGRANRIFSGSPSGPEQRDEVKVLLRSIAPGGNSADFTGALRERGGREGIMAYTLLVTGSTAGYSPLSGPEIADLLRYSRVQEFSGWRAIVAAQGIESRVRNAASAWLN